MQMLYRTVEQEPSRKHLKQQARSKLSVKSIRLKLSFAVLILVASVILAKYSCTNILYALFSFAYKSVNEI